MKKPLKVVSSRQARFFKRLLLLFLGSTTLLHGQALNPRADSAISAFNNAFLVTQNGGAYYKSALNNGKPDENWVAALDIFGMQDTYERTKSAADKALVTTLGNTFLQLNPPPYAYDGWNDDIAWMGLSLARGYQLTGTANFLKQAEYCFNLAYDRGWNTVFNGGGIWEQQPDMTPTTARDGVEKAPVNKEALSNNTTGKLACLLYESTGNAYYKDKALQIYAWSRSHLFNPLSGQVYAGIDRAEVVNKSSAVYNQGTFVDFAAHLHKITGDETLLRDAQAAAKYVINTTPGGIISRTDGYLNTWADEYARGLGHLCMWNPQLWNTYYPFMKQNADAAWKNRRTDLNISWNGWAVPTPADPAGIASRYVSTVAMLQFTPTIQPLPATIEAEAYNFIEGAAPEALASGGKAVGSIESGDWLEYLVRVPASGLYTMTFRVAGTTAGSMEIQQNNVKLTSLHFPATRGNFWTVATIVKLDAGIQSLKLKATSGGWKIDKFTARSGDEIIPFVSVNKAPAQQLASVAVNVGDQVQLRPEPGDGIWGWTGPGGFLSISRVVTLAKISSRQGGIYTARRVNYRGGVSVQDFVVTVKGCAPTPLTATAQVNEAAPLPVDSLLTVPAGSYVALEAQPQAGKWAWTGPNGFAADSRKISFLTIDYKQAGRYTATYTNPSGCVSTQVIRIALTGPDPYGTAITPYLNVNDVAWQQQEYASLNPGDKISVGPQPFDAGTWQWTGPNNFTATTRDFTLSNFTAQQAGTYTATFTNAAGYVSSQKFVFGLKGTCTQPSITPLITVNGVAAPSTSSVSVRSGDNVLIKFPAAAGSWRWTGPNGFTSDSSQAYFGKILFWRKGTYEINLIGSNACISTYTVDVDVVNNDYCGTPIIPYFNVNDGAWQSDSLITVNEGDKLQIGPQPNKNMWVWNGPGGFFKNDRQFALENIQATQSGIYRATYTNSSGCLSFKNFVVTVNKANALTGAARESQGLSAYPNPATGEVLLTSVAGDEKIVISDLYGQTILQPKPTAVGGGVKIDVHALEPGLYFITVGSSTQKRCKLIKK